MKVVVVHIFAQSFGHCSVALIGVHHSGEDILLTTYDLRSSFVGIGIKLFRKFIAAMIVEISGIHIKYQLTVFDGIRFQTSGGDHAVLFHLLKHFYIIVRGCFEMDVQRSAFRHDVLIAVLLCFLAAAAVVLWERRKARKTMEEIERMLDAAMTGSFSETNFDESQLSALETKFAHYLSAAEASSRNVAQEKDKIKTLIADISHQTKMPIANLLLYSELLMEETLPASAKANVEALYKQSEKLRFLIDSLVKLSRLENGIISLFPQPAALQPLLESVVEQYAAKASEKGLSLQMQDADAFAVFDFKWTAEALANIVDNAIKYTEHGTITISAVSYEMFARIDISDTGSGIPETEQAKIFARFYRSNSVQKQEGVGIGLYLARQIISGEGGYIKVASVPGKGSTFSIFLPK